MNDAAEVQLLGGQNGKAIGQVKPHLMTEEAERSCSGPVRTFLPLIEELLQQVEILLHLILLAGLPAYTPGSLMFFTTTVPMPIMESEQTSMPSRMHDWEPIRTLSPMTTPPFNLAPGFTFTSLPMTQS